MRRETAPHLGELKRYAPPLATFTAEHRTPNKPLRYAVRWLPPGNRAGLQRDKRAKQPWEWHYDWYYFMTEPQAVFIRDLLTNEESTARLIELEYPVVCTSLRYRLTTSCRVFFYHDGEEVMRTWAYASDAWSFCFRWERRRGRKAEYYFLANAMRCGACGSRVYFGAREGIRGPHGACKNKDCGTYRHYTDTVDWRVRVGLEPSDTDLEPF